MELLINLKHESDTIQKIFKNKDLITVRELMDELENEVVEYEWLEERLEEEKRKSDYYATTSEEQQRADYMADMGE